MASLEHRPERRKPWRIRWRDANGRGRSRSFARKADALRYLHELDVRLDRGHHRDPTSGRAALAEIAETWYDQKVSAGRKPSTVIGYRSILDSIILPSLGGEPVAAITYPALTTWLRDLDHLSGSRRRHIIGVLAQVLDMGVRLGHIDTNPARLLDKPTVAPRRRHRYLDHRQLHDLANACGDYRPFILLLGYTGLRWGEAAALRGSDVDRVRGLIHVDRSQTEAGGSVAYVAPKTHQRRDVPVPDLVLDVLQDTGDALLFTAPRRGPLRHRNFARGVWLPATVESGCEGLRVHELRHTAASLARAAGADAFVVARMLGHGDASITAKTYADLFDIELGLVRRRMQDAATQALGHAWVTPERDTQVQTGTRSDNQWRETAG
jgi:integrase